MNIGGDNLNEFNGQQGMLGNLATTDQNSSTGRGSFENLILTTKTMNIDPKLSVGVIESLEALLSMNFSNTSKCCATGTCSN